MTRFGWLIEAPGQRYLTVQEISNRYDFVWSQDHSIALRFCNEKQADAAMMAIRQMAHLTKDSLFAFESPLGVARPVEHAWTQREEVEAVS